MRSLGHKLLLSYSLLILGFLGGSAWGIYHFTVLGRSVRLIMSNNYRSVLDAETMKETMERQDSAMMFHVAGEHLRARQQYEANRQRFAAALEDAADNLTEAGEREVVADIGARFREYTALDRSFLADTRRSPTERTAYYFRVLEPAFSRLKNRSDDLLQLNQNAMVRSQHRAEAQAAWATRASVVLAVLVPVLALAFAANFSRRLVAPLRRLAEAAKRIGEGDLEQHIEAHTGDEVQVLAEEFGRMTVALRAYRQREAARLHVAEEQAEAAINHLYEPVVVTDAAGELIGLNHAAEALFGPAAGWLHRRAEDLGLATVSGAIREAIESREPVALEGDRGLAALPRDHGEACFRVRTAPLLQAGVGVTGTVTVLEDVTRLRQVDRLKDEFISVASHELRTPLTSMQMSVALLAEGSAGELNPRQQRLVRMAAQDAQRLDRVTRDLLDLTRLEAGTTVLHRTPVSAADLVEAALGPLRASAEEKRIALETAVDAGLPLVSGDLPQLSRVLSNLVGNAIRHTPAGGRVRVEAAATDTAVEFRVSDTGEGIPPEYLPRIFERFVQVPGATSGGAGLGLPIARKIVETHGGKIGAESTLGHGATFFFSIPRTSEVEGGQEPLEVGR